MIILVTPFLEKQGTQIRSSDKRFTSRAHVHKSWATGLRSSQTGSSPQLAAPFSSLKYLTYSQPLCCLPNSQLLLTHKFTLSWPLMTLTPLNSIISYLSTHLLTASFSHCFPYKFPRESNWPERHHRSAYELRIEKGAG